jgi:phage tail tape-measure protein
LACGPREPARGVPSQTPRRRTAWPSPARPRLHEGDDRRALAVSDRGRGRRRSGGLATAMGQKAELGRLAGRCAALQGGLERAAAYCCCWAAAQLGCWARLGRLGSLGV